MSQSVDALSSSAGMASAMELRGTNAADSLDFTSAYLGDGLPNGACQTLAAGQGRVADGLCGGDSTVLLVAARAVR
eukprot:scaffold644_cov353-Prasinococcus_capsulatus_cf.AAC.12